MASGRFPPPAQRYASRRLTRSAGTQDYGYWYGSYIYPNLASCFIAIDQATAANGALTVLRGSHAAGRIEHGEVRGQPGGEADRVELLASHFEEVVCEMDPGDCLLFHCNLLHRSNPNGTPNPRWALVTCYCALDNPSVGASDLESEDRVAVDVLDTDAIVPMAKEHLRRLQAEGGPAAAL